MVFLNSLQDPVSLYKSMLGDNCRICGYLGIHLMWFIRRKKIQSNLLNCFGILKCHLWFPLSAGLKPLFMTSSRFPLVQIGLWSYNPHDSLLLSYALDLFVLHLYPKKRVGTIFFHYGKLKCRVRK